MRRTTYRRKALLQQRQRADEKPAPPPPPGPIARVSDVVIRIRSEDELKELYADIIPRLYRDTPGFEGAFLLLDRSKNRARSVTLWTDNNAFEVAAAHPAYADAMGKLAAYFTGVPEASTWEHGGSFFPATTTALKDQTDPPAASHDS